MPEVTIRSRNSGSKNLTTEQRRLMKDFIAWSAERLLGKRLANGVEIDLILDGNLFKKERTYGYAIWEDKHYRGRQFTIEIDSTFSFLNILHTLGHEMVHIKQYAKGELYLSESQGEYDIYMHNKIPVSTKEVDYWELPWEWEAHGRAIGLVVLWLRERKHNENDWAKERVFLGS